MPDVILKHVPLPDDGVSAGRPRLIRRNTGDAVMRRSARAGSDLGCRLRRSRTQRQSALPERVRSRGSRRRSCCSDRADGACCWLETRASVTPCVAGLPVRRRAVPGVQPDGTAPRRRRPDSIECSRTWVCARADPVGVVGWKYLTTRESDDPGRPAWVPAVIVDSLAASVGRSQSTRPPS